MWVGRNSDVRLDLDLWVGVFKNLIASLGVVGLGLRSCVGMETDNIENLFSSYCPDIFP